MTSPSLKTVSIDELQIGMYVYEIAEYKSEISIKARGRVLKRDAISTLKKKGVQTLVIDLSKSRHVTDNERPKEKDNAARKVHTRTSFSAEINRACQLHDEGKLIQQTLLESVKQNSFFDKHVPKDFCSQIVNSINRNPNALLCMTKIREKDEYLLEHSLNVSILLAHFGREFGMDNDDIDELAYAGFVHDLGKIKVPDEILHKPGRLTDEEMAIMKLHVDYGVDVLHEIGIDPGLIQTVSEHHERLDGKGYPAGKSADEISLQGRMIAIVDVYDALTADRVYKPGMSSQKALQILLQDCPHKYDEYLVKKFIKCVGIYPVGSLVMLSNERIAIVLQQHEEQPTKPKVRVFYSAKHRHYLESKDIDLKTESTLKIERPVMASEYNIDTRAFFERSVMQ
ncbi:HD-GYP domain-containing protein [Aestuariibacter salexigens]|uniref:HD-GYP domain-containing protein n=1 Tax=Aestuariibacter salexigens TaxID=226010 RepID=UPI00040ECAFC|nr:HD-GYP domain-containing protein [Aestuariibacter salexigens]